VPKPTTARATAAAGAGVRVKAAKLVSAGQPFGPV